MQTIEIIYQHHDFIIIDKPCGVSVHKDREEIGLTQMLAQQLNVEQVWLVHRLDKITSGLLILALNETTAANLSNLFAQHLIQKTYIALSEFKPKKKQGLIIGDMQKSRRSTWKLTQSRENPAITRFTSVSCEPNLRVFVLYPQTGKTQKLCFEGKILGAAVLGDERKGEKREEKRDRTYLHAYALDFCYQNRQFHITCSPKCGQFFQRNSVVGVIQNIFKDDE